MTFPRPLRGLLAVTLGATLCAAATAAPVTYSFTGSVNYDEADRGYAAFAGSFTFDGAAANLINDPSGSTGAYTGPAGAPWVFSLAFDGGAALDFGGGLFMTIANNLGGMDQWGLLATGGDGTVSAMLYDFTMAALTGSGQPLREGGYTLADFGWSDFAWDGDAGRLQGLFTSLNCTAGCVRGGTGPVDPVDPGDPGHTVPEPGSLLLALTGLGLLRRRRR